MKERRWAVHFGIYPSSAGLNVDGHSDPGDEHEIILPPALEAEGVIATISGSWRCWGPADQLSDGDKSLHIVVTTPQFDADPYDVNHIDDIFKALTTLPGVKGRWLDYAVVTNPDDWSEASVVALFKGHTTFLVPWKNINATGVS